MAARTDAERVTNAYGGSLDVASETMADAITDAHLLVDQRVSDHLPAEHPRRATILERLETLVAAHYAYPDVVGALDEGVRVAADSDMDTSVEYDTDVTAVGPDGLASPFWARALDVDPTNRLGRHTRSPTSVFVN
ncbi:hypothetical protein [Halomarina oriensis]|uniref:Uncharacterized protein n=1 Tax=Halomarina oriensis TaxID=671145 RepID=A0A6B0GNV6_9EURY|nr:hypothetical protein [Halomarina oriensis]MWG36474.1 hypothetical protein [Halomarina oriensis]